MDNVIKGNLKVFSSRVKENKYSQTEILMKDNIARENRMGKENIHGKIK